MSVGGIYNAAAGVQSSDFFQIATTTTKKGVKMHFEYDFSFFYMENVLAFSKESNISHQLRIDKTCSF